MLPLIFAIFIFSLSPSIAVKAETEIGNNSITNTEAEATENKNSATSKRSLKFIGGGGGGVIPGTGGGGGGVIGDVVDTGTGFVDDVVDVVTDPFESAWKEMKAAAEATEQAYNTAADSWNLKFSTKELELNNQVTSLNQQFDVKATQYNLDLGDTARYFQEIYHLLSSAVDALTVALGDLYGWLKAIVTNEGGCGPEGNEDSKETIACLEGGLKIVGDLVGNACGIVVGGVGWLLTDVESYDGNINETDKYKDVWKQMDEIYDRFGWHIPPTVEIRKSKLVNSGAMATPYAIYIAHDVDDNDTLLSHEFTHLLQYHRWGENDAIGPKDNMAPVKTWCDSYASGKGKPKYEFHFVEKNNLFDYNTEQQAEIVMYYWLFKYHANTLSRNVRNLKLKDLTAYEKDVLKIHLTANPDDCDEDFVNAYYYRDRTIEELTTLFGNLVYRKTSP